jgi:hypothetical protein
LDIFSFLTEIENLVVVDPTLYGTRVFLTVTLELILCCFFVNTTTFKEFTNKPVVKTHHGLLVNGTNNGGNLSVSW